MNETVRPGNTTSIDSKSKAPIVIGDGPNLDAFSRLRVSNPENLFNVQCQYDLEPLQMEAGATGAGTTPAHNTNTRMVDLVSSGVGTSYFQSYRYLPYQPSKSQFIAITGVLEDEVEGAVKEVGYFDSENGIFFRQNGTGGMQVVRRTKTSGSIVETVIDQKDWNIDRFDRYGPSGILFDPKKAHIFIIDLQFLGMGRVRLGLDIDGVIYYCHQFLNANNLNVPYMQTGSLPVQALLTTTSAEATMHFKCAAVNSEGGFVENLGYPFATPEGTVTADDGAFAHILSIRPKALFNSKPNRMSVQLIDLDLTVTGSNSIRWAMCVGSAFSAAPTWNDIDANYSAYEYGVGGTHSSLGLVIASGFVPASNQSKAAVSKTISQKFPVTLDRAGNQRAFGTMSLFVYGIGGTSATRAVLNYSEIR